MLMLNNENNKYPLSVYIKTFVDGWKVCYFIFRT